MHSFLEKCSTTYFLPFIPNSSLNLGLLYNFKIALEIKGEGGFGYDPIFIPEGYGHSFAQLGSNIKNQISHRQQALKKMRAYFDEDQAIVIPASK